MSSEKKRRRQNSGAVTKSDNENKVGDKTVNDDEKKPKRTMEMVPEIEELRIEVPDADCSTQVKADNDFFIKVINMIPPQFYFDEETNKDIVAMRGAEGAKQKMKGERRAGSTNDVHMAMKRARFDPDTNQTVHQLKAHLQHKMEKNPKSNVHRAVGVDSTLDEARARLHRRLEELKLQRTSMTKGVYKDEVHRLKRRESKLKRKIRIKHEKTRSNGSAPLPKINGDFSTDSPTAKPIFNKDGKLVYSKFDFTDLGSKDKVKGELTGKNYQKLLAKVEKRNEKLKKLKESDPGKAANFEEKLKWQSALQRAEGIKVKDNPDLLKKALKTKDKQKQMKTKKWESRMEKTEKMQNEKQDVRQTNIRAQKQKNLDRKVMKMKKKGRLIPGF